MQWRLWQVAKCSVMKLIFPTGRNGLCRSVHASVNGTQAVGVTG